MRVFAAQSANQHTYSPKHNASSAVVRPNPVAFPSISQSGGELLQRKLNCACGGGCPSCAEGEAAQKIQTKLTVSTPGDHYEQEADRVADQIMRMPDTMVQRQCESCIDTSAGSNSGAQDLTIQRQANEKAGSRAVTSEFTNRLGSGQPLDLATRTFMEPRFGRSFSRVRIHTGERAAESAKAVNALAYTLGSDIVFARNQFAPQTRAGRELLAHELTHVVQQRRGLQPMIQRRGESPRCPMTGVPAAATTPPQRNTGYCNGFNCHPTNPWLHCACNVSRCIPLAIEALRGQGWRGGLYYWHLDQIVTLAGHTGSFFKGVARDKANFYEDVNECFYNNWRLGYAQMYEVGTSPNPAWHNAQNACPIGGEDTRSCSDAQVVAEWNPVGCGTGPRSGRAIPFGYDPAWGNSNAFPGFGNETLTGSLTPEGCSFPGITPTQWNNASSQIAAAQSICGTFVGSIRPLPPPTMAPPRAPIRQIIRENPTEP
jgi:hypothetical protein